MTTNQILSLGSELVSFLAKFAGSFGRKEPRGKLAIYVRGQLSELPRKSIEPMALAAGVPPRTLQEFLASDDWNEDRLGADVRCLVAAEHADPQAIGVIDESGHPRVGFALTSLVNFLSQSNRQLCAIFTSLRMK